MQNLTRSRLGTLALACMIGGCSAGSPTTSSPTTPATGTQAGRVRALAGRSTDTLPTPAASPTPVAPVAPTTAPASCPLGYGVVDPPCSAQSPQHLPAIEAAIAGLVATQPGMFDLTQQAEPGSYKVRDQGALERGVVDSLSAQGFCAQVRDGSLQVKNSNQFSESYTLVKSSGFLWRGEGSYHNTCTPAAFPVNPVDVIKRIRIGFYEMKCTSGPSIPPPSPFAIYAGCRGTLTASPKDANDDDVPADVHGPDITWEIESGEDILLVEDYPNVPFNKFLQGLGSGEFRICATVDTVRSCMNGSVL